MLDLDDRLRYADSVSKASNFVRLASDIKKVQCLGSRPLLNSLFVKPLDNTR